MPVLPEVGSRIAGPGERPLLLGVLDQRARDAVLDRAGRVARPRASPRCAPRASARGRAARRAACCRSTGRCRHSDPRTACCAGARPPYFTKYSGALRSRLPRSQRGAASRCVRPRTASAPRLPVPRDPPGPARDPVGGLQVGERFGRCFADRGHRERLRAGRGDADLQVRRIGDADLATADVGDRLAGAAHACRPARAPAWHGRSRRSGRRPRPVSTCSTGAAAAEAVDSLVDDRAGGHGELDESRPALVGGAPEVDPGVQRPRALRRDAPERIEREHPASARRRLVGTHDRRRCSRRDAAGTLAAPVDPLEPSPVAPGDAARARAPSRSGRRCRRPSRPPRAGRRPRSSPTATNVVINAASDVLRKSSPSH